MTPSPPGKRPGAARAAPELVALDAEGIRELEGLHRRVERVRHRHVDGRGAASTRAGALPAPAGLVVGEAVVSEDDVVHRPLSLSGYGDRVRERGEDHVHDPARRLRVARGDRGRRPRVDERARRGANGDRGECASRSGQVGRGQAADDVEARRAGDRERAVEVAAMLIGAVPSKSMSIESPAIVTAARSSSSPSGVSSASAPSNLPSGRSPSRPRDDPLGVREKLVHRGCDASSSSSSAELVDSAVCERVRRELSAKVATALVGVPHAGDEALEGRCVESRRRDHHAFLRERLRPGREAAGLRASDVGVVRAGDRIPERRPGDDREVRKVCSTRVRVVEDPGLPRRGILLANRGDGLRHRAEVNRDVLGLRDHAPFLVEERGRAVAALLDVGGERGADEHCAHLLGDRAEAAADHLQLDRNHVVRRRTSVPYGSVSPDQPSGTQAVEPSSSRTCGPRAVRLGPPISTGGAARISAVRTATSSSDLARSAYP